jgi:hypothetical protein
MDERLARIQPTLVYDRFSEADIVVEAVFERMELKKQVFAELDRVARPDAILASNTSTLDIDEIWRYGDNLALRKDQWKLYKTNNYWKLYKTNNYPAQLYDPTRNVGETTDLAAKEPQRVKELEVGLAKWNAQLIAPLCGTMPPHARNLDWLYDVQQDPRLLPGSLATQGAAKSAGK